MSKKQKIIQFICIIVIIHTVLCFGILFINNNKNDHALQFKKFKSYHTKFKILFMGDSHVVRSLDESKIDSSYSLAYFGENNMMNYYKLKHVLNLNLEKPEYIVLPCDIITFSKGLNLYRTNKLFYYPLLPLSEIKHLNENTLYAYYDYLKIKLIPYSEWQYAFNKMNVNRQKKATKTFSDLSFINQKKEAKRFVQDELLMGSKKENLFNKSSLDFLNRTIQLCKNNNIKLIFVKFPITQSIYDEIKYNVDSAYINNRPSEEVIKKSNIPILNFESIYLNNPELFFDSHHLNVNGKNKFTIIFKQKIDSLLQLY